MNTGNTNGEWWKPGMIIFVKVSGYIAGPIIVALYVGKYVDAKYHTEPYGSLGCIAIAFFVTMYMIWREMKVYIKNNHE